MNTQDSDKRLKNRTTNWKCIGHTARLVIADVLERKGHIDIWCQQMPKNLPFSEVKGGNEKFAIFLCMNLYLNPSALGFGTMNRLGWYPQNHSVTGIGPTTPWPRSLEKIWWGFAELCYDINRLKVWNQGGAESKIIACSPNIPPSSQKQLPGFVSGQRISLKGH